MTDRASTAAKLAVRATAVSLNHRLQALPGVLLEGDSITSSRTVSSTEAAGRTFGRTTDNAREDERTRKARRIGKKSERKTK